MLESSSGSTGLERQQQQDEGERQQNAWVSLAKLYKTIGEEDVLRGLLEKRIAKHPLTKQALYYELSGDYLEAFNVYEAATQQLDNNQLQSPSSLEVCYYY
jgi:hypothetical protein